MGEFFKPWRRKAGLLTLVMALMLMAGWVRSLSCFDFVNCRIGYETCLQISSNRSHLVVNRIKESPDSIDVTMDWHTYPATDGELFLPPKNWDESIILVRGNHIILGEWNLLNLRYWSVVIPLTLISFWLLFSKRRKAALDKITEPAPADGK